MCNGLAALEDDHAYAKILMRMLGMTTPLYRYDEVQVVLKAHQFFIGCQEKWVKRVTEVDKEEAPSAEKLCNISNGGICSVFEIIDGLKEAFEHDKQMTDRLLSTLKPDNLAPSIRNAAK